MLVVVFCSKCLMVVLLRFGFVFSINVIMFEICGVVIDVLEIMV